MFKTAVLLFTTHYNCRLWNSASWENIGYTPKCIDFDGQSRLLQKYCRHKPLYRIQYADIARLLILYENGGWYVDSDTLPTPRCQKLRIMPNTTFGLESDFPTLQQANQMGMLQKSIAMWAFYGVKNDSRLLRMACKLAGLSTRPRESSESFGQYIHHTSGPTMYAKLWNYSTLPVSVFGCGQQHSNAPPCNAPSCWGCHQFKNTWLHS